MKYIYVFIPLTNGQFCGKASLINREDVFDHYDHYECIILEIDLRSRSIRSLESFSNR